MFPLFISLENKTAILIGGGTIAARRVEQLLAFGARVTVIAPILHASLQNRLKTECFRWEARPYNMGDLTGAVLAVAAADVRAVNHAVALEAHALKIPVSVADCKEESSFYFPAIARGGGVVTGIISETGGAHRTVRETAAKIREVLHATENHTGRQPGKPAGRHTGTDRDGCHPKTEPQP